ncbi:MAG: phosphate acetyltransferase [Bacilli bacterium]|nr:phosphate acetyltransferase [Bacilli bacterium]
MIINKIIELAKKDKKNIVLVETNDIRTLKAASEVKSMNFADITLIGNEENIMTLAKDNNIMLDDIKIIDPKTSLLTKELIEEFFNLRKSKGMSYEEASDIISNDYLYFGDMLVYMDYADGLVAGATHSSSDVLRAALKTVKTAPDSKIVSSFFLMETENKNIGQDGIFIFSDCGMIQNPTSEELVNIAYSSQESFKKLVGEIPKIAFLSHSTNGSSKCEDVDKVKNAVNMFKEKYPNILADGELQLDAAIVKEISEKKYPDSKIKGDANILIFPDLDAGNIAYKTAERIGNAKAYGPITQGIRKPINDLSRGCNYKDIVGAIAITCVQAK